MLQQFDQLTQFVLELEWGDDIVMYILFNLGVICFGRNDLIYDEVVLNIILITYITSQTTTGLHE
jgi:hypothetical protein